MFHPSPAIRIFLYDGITDMRRSFDGFSAIVSQSLGMNTLTDDFFVFFNRNRNLCKILLWGRDGFVVWAKRLERGSFQAYRANNADRNASEIDVTTLAMILGGVDVNSAKKRKRYAVNA
jgi:transposase